MTPRTLIAATLVFAFAGAGSAFAQEGTQDFAPAQQLSTKSRAEVRAELLAAQRDGTLEISHYGEASPAPLAASTLTRAQVVAETREAQRLGLLGADEQGLRVATPAQAEQIHAAGLRAITQQTAQLR